VRRRRDVPGACPVAIDTGALMKEFRRRERTDREETVALALARNYAAVERAPRIGITGARAAAGAVGTTATAKIPAAIRERVSRDLVPSLPSSLPAAAHPTMPAPGMPMPQPSTCPPASTGSSATPMAVTGGLTLPQALVEVSARAGLPVWIPDDVAGHCCGTPWSSKGYTRGHDHMAAKSAAALWRWSDAGRLPVVIDASSCAQGLAEELAPHLPDPDRERFERIEILDSIAWVHDRLLEHLSVARKVPCAALHPTCSATRMGLSGKLGAIAAELADEVRVPAGTTCCGMAGDRGMLHPELPASALRDAAADLLEHPCAEHLSSNRTCEIGLQEVTGQPYGSFVAAARAPDPSWHAGDLGGPPPGYSERERAPAAGRSAGRTRACRDLALRAPGLGTVRGRALVRLRRDETGALPEQFGERRGRDRL